jgi:undecaprenyl diphosphate synthase
MRDYFTSQSSLHVGIIMDGNGRWATARGLPRLAGHEAGAGAVNRVVEAAPGCGIAVLTLFAFSSDNWSRPKDEVAALMRLLACYLEREGGRCLENGVRLEVIGRRDRLSRKLLAAIAKAERATAGCSTLRLRIAVDYSARDAILAAARGLPQLSRESLELRLGPPVDLLIRTGGEQRLSDFLLWECAYAELVFARRMWPDFDASDLASALQEYHCRERRFGAVPVPPARRLEAWLD